MLGRTDSRRRLIVLVLALIVAASALVARLAWWQVVQQGTLAGMAHAQTHLSMTVNNQRGAIYDRSGTVVLATTVDRVRVVAAAEGLTAEARTADVARLGDLLDLDPAGRIDLDGRLRTGRPYVVLARDIEPQRAELLRTAILDGSLTGISLEVESARVYPQAGGAKGTTLAAGLIGFVNRDGQGQYGVEQYYDDRLAGAPTVFEAEKGADGRAIPDTELIVQPGVPGADLRLTIDAGLQLAVEQEALAAWIADGAASVSAVVMNPYNGEVLAEATYPSYDANDYRTIAADDPSRFVDPVISSVYEPGSVFKMLTVVAGLEQGTVTPTTVLQDQKVLVLDDGKARVRDADRKSMGELTLQDAIANSRNVVAAKVALGLAPTLKESSSILHEVWTRFGFGAPTGVDLAGEVAGLVRDPAISAWREIDLANGSFGQGVAVTPLQLARAYAAMVNGGTLVQPHVVASIGGGDTLAQAGQQVLAADLEPTLIGMLNHVVTSVKQYAAGALVPGYFVGGKTGTAQIWDPSIGDWKPDIYNFSFVGFIGRQVGRPDLVVALRLGEVHPTVTRVGVFEMPVKSWELFGRIATDAVQTPGLLPELAPDATAAQPTDP
jgi:cell division protein FtsI (penicillin-binding protein 3)